MDVAAKNSEDHVLPLTRVLSDLVKRPAFVGSRVGVCSVLRASSRPSSEAVAPRHTSANRVCEFHVLVSVLCKLFKHQPLP